MHADHHAGSRCLLGRVGVVDPLGSISSLVRVAASFRASSMWMYSWVTLCEPCPSRARMVKSKKPGGTARPRLDIEQ
jgi:hypothetical protein